MSKRASKVVGILTSVFTALFCISITVGLIGRVLCIRNNRHYAEKQDEIFVVEEIAMVLQSKDSELVYVCYNDATCVNVYTASGEFQWAVSTPYMRNAYFELTDGQLVIYNDDAYLYDALSGDFIEKTDAESLNLSYDQETESVPVDGMAVGTVCFDAYEVYRVAEDGSPVTIVERPGWYILFNFALCLVIAFACGIAIGILTLITKIAEERSQRRAQKQSSPAPTPLSKKTKFILRYFQVTTAVHAVYAVADIVCAFFGAFLTVGIIPLTIHFILSSGVFMNIIERTKLTEYEKALLGKWQTIGFASFVAAFLSVLVAVICAGG